jgi:hypothetical protein
MSFHHNVMVCCQLGIASGLVAKLVDAAARVNFAQVSKTSGTAS